MGVGETRPLAEPRLDKQVFKLFHSFIEPILIGYKYFVFDYYYKLSSICMLGRIILYFINTRSEARGTKLV